MAAAIKKASAGSARRLVVNFDEVEEISRRIGRSTVGLADWGSQPLYTGEAPLGRGCDLIAAAEHPAAGIPGLYGGGPCFVGVEIAARQDLFVIWVDEAVGDVLWTREIIARRRISFAEQDALLDDVMRRYRVVRVRMDQTAGLNVRVRLLSGFVMEEQVFVGGTNLGWITITGTSTLTQIDRSKLTRAYGGSYPAFVAHSGGWLPVIAQLFEMSSAGAADGRDGIMASGAGSGVRINEGKGVRRAGGAGLRVVSSASATAPQADFRQAGTYGIVANGCAAVDAPGAVVTACGAHGLWASAGSTINASDALATGCGAGGVLATLGGRVNADGVRARKGAADEPEDITISSGGIVNASGAIGGTSVMPNTPWSAGLIFK